MFHVRLLDPLSFPWHKSQTPDLILSFVSFFSHCCIQSTSGSAGGSMDGWRAGADGSSGHQAIAGRKRWRPRHDECMPVLAAAFSSPSSTSVPSTGPEGRFLRQRRRPRTRREDRVLGPTLPAQQSAILRSEGSAVLSPAGSPALVHARNVFGHTDDRVPEQHVSWCRRRSERRWRRRWWWRRWITGRLRVGQLRRDTDQTGAGG